MSGTQAVLPAANDGGVSTTIDAELAQALLLVRVSTMKMLRLQLAIERRDRAVAMQAVEDLMELDAWMAGSAVMSADVELMEAIAAEVDDQRSALLHEKFGLAAGLVKRAATEGGPRGWTDPAAEAEDAEDEAVAVPDYLGPAQLADAEEEQEEDELPARGTRWWAVVVFALLILAVAAAGAAIALGWWPAQSP